MDSYNNKNYSNAKKRTSQDLMDEIRAELAEINNLQSFGNEMLKIIVAAYGNVQSQIAEKKETLRSRTEELTKTREAEKKPQPLRSARKNGPVKYNAPKSTNADNADYEDDINGLRHKLDIDRQDDEELSVESNTGTPLITINSKEINKIIPVKIIVDAIRSLNEFSNLEDIRMQIGKVLENKYDMNATFVKNNLSQRLNYLRKSEIVVSVKVGKGTHNIFWGLDEWLLDADKRDGNTIDDIKDGHKYDVNKVKGLKNKFKRP